MVAKKIKVFKKATRIKRVIRSRFKRDVRELQRLCEDQGFTLLSYSDASDTCTCVLSEDEYEIGSTKSECDSANQSYFLNYSDYEGYLLLDS